MLGDRIDEMVKRYLIKLRDCGGVVNTSITIAGARGIILKMDKSQLVTSNKNIFYKNQVEVGMTKL